MSVVPAPRTTDRLDVDTLLYPCDGWALYTCHVLRLKQRGGVSIEEERWDLGARPRCEEVGGGVRKQSRGGEDNMGDR